MSAIGILADRMASPVTVLFRSCTEYMTFLTFATVYVVPSEKKSLKSNIADSPFVRLGPCYSPVRRLYYMVAAMAIDGETENQG